MHNISVHQRRAVILFDNRKGLIEAIIFFEDGGTKIQQSFPGKPETMMENLNTVKKKLVANYQIPLGNLITRKAELAGKRSERREQIGKTFALGARPPRKAAKKRTATAKVQVQRCGATRARCSRPLSGPFLPPPLSLSGKDPLCRAPRLLYGF